MAAAGAAEVAAGGVADVAATIDFSCLEHPGRPTKIPRTRISSSRLRRSRLHMLSPPILRLRTMISLCTPQQAQSEANRPP